MKKILMVIKYDFKNIWPVLACTISLLIIISCQFIYFIKAEDSADLSNYVIYHSIVCQLSMGICLAGILYITVKRTWFNINIYKISDVKENAVVFARYLLIVGSMMLFAFICVLANTAIYALADSQSVENIQFYNYYSNELNMIGKPFGSWFIIPAVGILSGLIYSGTLAVTPLVYRIDNQYVKWVSIVVTLLGLALLQTYCCSILLKLFPGLDFNTYIRNGVLEYYLYRNDLSVYGAEDIPISYISLNLFNGVVLIWEAVFVSVCIMLYSTRITKAPTKSDKGSLKLLIIKYAVVLMFLLINICSLGFATGRDFDKTVYSTNAYTNTYPDDKVVTIYAHSGDTIYFPDYVELAEYNDKKFKPYYVCSGHGGRMSSGQLDTSEKEFNEGYKIEGTGKYYFIVYIENRYTEEKYGMDIKYVVIIE